METANTTTEPHSARRPLSCVAMDIGGLLPRTTLLNQYVVLLTNCYSGLAQAVTTLKSCKAYMVSILYDYLILHTGYPPFCKQTTTHKSKITSSKPFVTSFWLKQLTRTAYYTRPLGKPKISTGHWLCNCVTTCLHISPSATYSCSHSCARTMPDQPINSDETIQIGVLRTRTCLDNLPSAINTPNRR